MERLLPFAPLLATPADGQAVERQHAEPAHPYRSAFARDRARVLHARAFRRLAGKTQVFARRPADAVSDHFRSRLTHTLEVAQISRTLAEALGLNAEYAETLALVHDIGHPPFGHAGEKSLDRALSHHGLRFDHNLHALRIVTFFEERYAAFRGLNLTHAVREGIIKHSHDYTADEHPELVSYLLDQFPPLEAQIIDLADEIAYLTADLDDGLDSGILSVSQVLSEVPLFRRFYDEAAHQYPQAAGKLVVREALRSLLDALASDLLNATRAAVLRTRCQSLDDLRRAPQRLAMLSDTMESERLTAKRFLYAHLYNSDPMDQSHIHADRVVAELFDRLMLQPELLPADHQLQIPADGLARTVADYIAGMTDSYIEQLWQRIKS